MEAGGGYAVYVPLQRYPVDHPLWDDINFTPEDIHQTIAAAKQRTPSGVAPPPPPPPAQQQAPSPQVSQPSRPAADAVVGSTYHWSEDDDALLCYMQTADAKQRGITPEAIAPLINRTANACSGRWSRLVAQLGQPWASSPAFNALAARGRVKLVQMGQAALLLQQQQQQQLLQQQALAGSRRSLS